MELMTLHTTFDSSGYYFLAGVLAASFFFAMLGLKLLKNDQYEGLILLAVSLFFFGANLIMLSSDNANSILNSLKLFSGMLHWINFIMGPATIMLFFILGIFSLLRFALSEAIFKTLLGIVLMMLIFTIGYNWPDILKASFVVSFTIFWFTLELKESVD